MLQINCTTVRPIPTPLALTATTRAAVALTTAVAVMTTVAVTTKAVVTKTTAIMPPVLNQSRHSDRC